MGEPSSTSIGLAGLFASLGLGAMFPNLDLAALVGAFGGAFFYVVFAKDMPIFRRVGYLFVGWIGGYFGAAEAIGWEWTRTTGLVAMGCGAVCVVFLAGLVEWVETGTMPRILRWFFSLRSGKGG